jgi:hypothetical protein
MSRACGKWSIAEPGSLVPTHIQFSLGASNQMGSNLILYLSPCPPSPCSPASFQKGIILLFVEVGNTHPTLQLKLRITALLSGKILNRQYLMILESSTLLLLVEKVEIDLINP